MKDVVEKDKTSGDVEKIPSVRTRKEVWDLYEKTGAAPDADDFGEALAQANPLIEMNNVFLPAPEKSEFPSGARSKTLFQHLSDGSYEAAESRNGGDEEAEGSEEGRKESLREEESLPSGLTPAMPWGGQEIGVWTDRHVLLLGRAAKRAFKKTEEEQIRRARLKSSPYRKAGLGRKEAEAAERRRIEKRKGDMIPSLEGIVPAEKRPVVKRIGFRCRGGHSPTREPIQVLFDRKVKSSRGETEGVLAVAKDKLDLALRSASSISPGARRRGEIEFRYDTTERGVAGLLSVHLKGYSLPEEKMSKMAEKMGGSRPVESTVACIAPLAPGGQEKELWERIPERMKNREPQAKGGSMKESSKEKKSRPSEGKQASMFDR